MIAAFFDVIFNVNCNKKINHDWQKDYLSDVSGAYMCHNPSYPPRAAGAGARHVGASLGRGREEGVAATERHRSPR